MGAWIETTSFLLASMAKSVAPLVGAWIETVGMQTQYRCEVSHPSWVRGLKLSCNSGGATSLRVAPLVGAWIETWVTGLDATALSGRTPRGCVD